MNNKLTLPQLGMLKKGLGKDYPRLSPLYVRALQTVPVNWGPLAYVGQGTYQEVLDNLIKFNLVRKRQHPIRLDLPGQPLGSVTQYRRKDATEVKE